MSVCMSNRTILNIRGTNGSGKTTSVRQLMAHFGSQPLMKAGKPWAYQLNGPIFVLGNYECECGGAEGLAFADIKREVLELADQGDVVFEGVIWSTVFKSSHELATSTNHRVIFARLDTPADVCVQRVIERRLRCGNDRPFDPKHVIVKHRDVLRVWNKLHSAGHDTRVLPHGEPLPSLIDWLQTNRDLPVL